MKFNQNCLIFIKISCFFHFFCLFFTFSFFSFLFLACSRIFVSVSNGCSLAMDANFLEGSISEFIADQDSPAWFCIDRLQRWQEVGSFWDLNLNQNFSWYRFHFIANEPIYLNFEFGLERELAAMEYHSSVPCDERLYAPERCIKGESVTLLDW